MQWNPPFGRVLRNYEGFVVVLRVIGALAIVYIRDAKSISASVHVHKSANYTRTRTQERAS